MTPQLLRTAAVLFVANLLGAGAGAQFPTGGPRLNPLTGGTLPQAQFNPLTGGGPAGQINPYTGKPMPVPAAVNPLTGKLQELKATPTPTAPLVYQWPKGKFPITGKAGPGLEPLDALVQGLMTRHGIPGASLVIAKDGKLVYAKGFGWADLTAAVAVNPLTVFGLASLSKPLTALAILWLFEHGQLDLDDRAFDILAHIKPLPGAKVDPNLKKITIRQLLNHTGGWDRTRSGDPTNWEPQIAQALGVAAPVSDEQFITFMMGVPLDFAPGSEYEYSNVGYVILGRIVEKVSGQPYETFVKKHVLEPAGLSQPFVSHGDRAYKKGEARRYLAGTSILLPPMDLPMVQAAGGWEASAVDMVRLLTALDGSRGKALFKPATFKQMLAPPPAPLQARPDGTYNGLGWPTVTPAADGFGYAHDGNFHGMRTFMKRSPRGVNWALLFNVSTQPDPVDAKMIAQAVQETRRRVESFEQYPDIDLFGQFP
jgi:N-acyl-D-amino-acid deacylase